MVVSCMMDKTGKDSLRKARYLSLGSGAGDDFHIEGDDDMRSIKLVGPTVVEQFKRAEQMYLLSGVI